MKTVIILIVSIILSKANLLAQPIYDEVGYANVLLDGTSLEDLEKILDSLGEPLSVTSYTPMEGETELYDTKATLSYNSLEVEYYKTGTIKSIASLQLNNKGHFIQIQGFSFKVGDSVEVLIAFPDSFADYKSRLEAMKNITDEISLYLSTTHPAYGGGVLNVYIRDNEITRISISLNPA